MNSTPTQEHPTTDVQPLIIPDFLLTPLVEVACSIIVDSTETDLPGNLRRISHFENRIANDSTARSQILQSLVSDAGFRSRVDEEFFSRIEASIALQQWIPENAHEIVQEAASRNDLPLLASVLWMRQLPRYQYGLGLIVATSSVSIIENEQRESLRADETRFQSLTQQIETERSRADLLKSDVDRLETELRQERTSRRISEQRYEAKIQSLNKKLEEHDKIVSQHHEGKSRLQERLEREASRAQELEARLNNIHDENRKKSEKISNLQEQLASALSSDVELNYEDLQSLLAAQKDAQSISDSLMLIMNKTRSIISHSSSEKLPQKIKSVIPIVSSGTIEPVASAIEPQVRVPRELVPQDISQSSDFVLDPDSVVLADGLSCMLFFSNQGGDFQRERIVEILSRLESEHNCSCVVVFDGESATARGRVQSKVHIVYAPSTVPARDVIIERIKVTPKEKSIVLISNDSELIDNVDSSRCNIISPNIFFRQYMNH